MKGEGTTKPAGTARSPLIVVADDDDTQRTVLARSLLSEGYRVVPLDDGGRIWDVLDREEAALLVLDLRMPGVNGWEVMRRLRFEGTLAPRAPRPRVVVVSAQTDRETRDFALSLGASAFLEKPLDLDLLAATVRRELAHEPARRPRSMDGARAGRTSGRRRPASRPR